MGFFTYRQTKKTKKQVQGLRRDQARIAAANQTAENRRAAVQRSDALFAQLPPEGKEEYRAIDAEFRATPRFGRAAVKRRRELIAMCDDLWRRYDLIP